MDRNLVAFLAVAKGCNLTQASEQLFLTQPTLSKRIANLELEIGAALFYRERRGMPPVRSATSGWFISGGPRVRRRSQHSEAFLRLLHVPVAIPSEPGTPFHAPSNEAMDWHVRNRVLLGSLAECPLL